MNIRNRAIETSGIYQIRNKKTGQRYIAASIRAEIQLRNQLTLLREGRHRSKSLQMAFDAYGEEAFEVSILEKCAPGNLWDRKRHFMTTNPEYNPRLGCPGKYGNSANNPKRSKQ